MRGTEAGTDLVIPSEVASFLQDGLIMFLGTRDPERVPEAVLAAGARVLPDGTLEAYVPSVFAQATRANAAHNGEVALSVSRVTDDRSMQLKGRLVALRDATDDDRRFLDGLLERREAAFAKVGIPRSVSARLVSWPCVAVRFRVASMFEQTPGPSAGEPL
ncbi:MAG: hypothetical protein VYE22_12380 [Myxococcota bacterium]|nr:hypothetical protein [Myxococcota bacterium]